MSHFSVHFRLFVPDMFLAESVRRVCRTKNHSTKWWNAQITFRLTVGVGESRMTMLVRGAKTSC
jgi:hypothetical protein